MNLHIQGTRPRLVCIGSSCLAATTCTSFNSHNKVFGNWEVHLIISPPPYITTGDEDIKKKHSCKRIYTLQLIMAQEGAKPTLGVLLEFDPKRNEWQIHRRRLQQYFLANRIQDPEIKRAILLNGLADAAYGLLQDLSVPLEPETRPYEDLIALFDNHFKPKRAVFVERYHFYNAKKEPDETLSEWVARVRKLATHCEFGGQIETVIRDKFIIGLESGKVLNRLLSEDNSLTLTKALELAKATEAAVMKYGIGTEDSEEMGTSSNRTKIKEEASDLNMVTSTQRRQTNTEKGGASRKFSAVKCSVCGDANHTKSQCRYRDYSCFVCGKKGHLKNICRDKSQKKIPTKRSVRSNYVDYAQKSLYNINSHENNVEPIVVKVYIANKQFEMELDSGSAISAVSYKFWQDNLKFLALKPSNIVLKSYLGERRRTCGKIIVNLKYKTQIKPMEIEVVEGGGPPIVGRNFMKKFGIQFQLSEVNKLNNDTDLNRVLANFKTVFADGLGYFRNGVVRLTVKSGAQPKIIKHRPLPFAIKEKVDEEINRLLKLKVISPVKTSEWASPIVPVIKTDGSIRICADYKTTLNPSLIIDSYPIPRVEELFAELRGGKEFSKIDLSNAYLQFPLCLESRKLTTISTHRGLFVYNRLPFGVASAPAIFQAKMEQLFANMSGVIVFFDDILITGSNRQEHLHKVTSVLKILRDNGLKIKREKCLFFQKEVKYLGYLIDKDGIHKSPEKIKAIKDAPVPQNKTQVKSFLGLVTYYTRFIGNMPNIAQPLYRLLKNNVEFNWDNKCEQSFKKLKRELMSEKFLCHYNPNLVVNLYVDASPYGLGACLTHSFKGGIEKPIIFASRTLNNAEKNYSQIDREALAIYFGVKKFHQYLYGRKFNLITDNKPLVHIFGPKKGVPVYAANRLQRYAVFLNNYNFEIKHISSSKNQADWFSRCPLEDSGEECNKITYLNFITKNTDLKFNIDTVRETGMKDKNYTEVLNFVKNGWPKQVSENLRAYFNRKLELTIEDKVLMLGYRVVIPTDMRDLVMSELHSTHMGIVKMKSTARAHVWWPGVDTDIEKKCKTCPSCLKFQDLPGKSKLIPWHASEGPWERIHADFFGPIKGQTFLIIVDSFSKWIEVFHMTNITTTNTINKFRELFSKFGLPKMLVTDNGTQFSASEFQVFCKLNGIKHITGAPYSPQTNGAAENAVKTVKKFICKEFGSNKSTQNMIIEIFRFLLDYRTTVHCTTGETPSKLFLGRSVRTRYDLLKPSSIKSKNCKYPTQTKVSQEKQKYYYRGKRIINFAIGEKCMARWYELNKQYYVPGKIVAKLGKLHYKVLINNKEHKRHIDQLRKGGLDSRGSL